MEVIKSGHSLSTSQKFVFCFNDGYLILNHCHFLIYRTRIFNRGMYLLKYIQAMAAHHTSSYTYLLEKNYQSLSCQWHIKTFHALTREHATYTARPLTHFAGAQHNWVFICKTRPTPNLICTQHLYFENLSLYLTVWKCRGATWNFFGKSEKEPGSYS